VTVALPARAKLNLDLHLTGRRPDGLHELRTHIVAIDLHDLLEAERADRTELAISGLTVANERTNSVLAAHAALERAAGRSLPTRFRLHKRIPPGSGLGGASSDAAATLRATAVLHGVKLDLAPVAAEAGADVTFFMGGGAALVEGTGELVTATPVLDAWFVVAWPGVELSTTEVYRAWDRVGGDGVNELRRAAAHIDRRIDEFAGRLGAGWQMTGSGSAFFRRFADSTSAEAAAASMACWTTVAHPVGAWA
jgi:4-diphosphocytidyl-2-C-methyl-D-erythritol kinase